MGGQNYKKGTFSSNCYASRFLGSRPIDLEGYPNASWYEHVAYLGNPTGHHLDEG